MSRMLATYKPDEITPISFDDAVKVVRTGLSSIAKVIPADRVTALVLAKLTLESGRTGTTLMTSCHDGNVGNIKAALDYDGMFTLYPCNEELNNVVVWFSPAGKLDKKGGTVVGEKYALPPDGDGHPQCRFRAYANVVDGIYEYLDFIFSGKYNDAAKELLLGDAAGYVHALKLAHYFTADEGPYAKSVASLQAEFVARLDGRPAPVISLADVSGLFAPQAFNERVAADTIAAIAATGLVASGDDAVLENFQSDFDDPDETTQPSPPKEKA